VNPVGGIRAGGSGMRGAEDFLALSKALKAAGQTELRKALHKGMASAAKPLLPKIRQSARDRAPKAGKLNERLARKPYRAQARTGAATAGVRIVGGKVDPRMNALGRVYHPVFGRKGKAANGGRNAVPQTVPELRGYFDEPIRESEREIRGDLIRALEDFKNSLVRGV